jgi:hypothetical protein
MGEILKCYAQKKSVDGIQKQNRMVENVGMANPNVIRDILI